MNKIMEKYKLKGFVKNARDEEGLHMYYSPYRIPDNLTKIGVRRAINGYFRNVESINKSKVNLLNTNRVNIFFNGELILGADVITDRPKNSKEISQLIKSLTKVLNAPRKLIKIMNYSNYDILFPL